MKRTASGLIALVLLLGVCMSSGAAAQTRASLYLSNYTVWATADGGGEVSFWYDVTATQVSDCVGVLTIQIQRKQNGVWTPVQTYSSSTTAGLMGTNRLFHDGWITYSGTAGQEYRASVTVYAARGGGSDSRVVTTNAVIG
jgi:hypothetical protein